VEITDERFRFPHTTGEKGYSALLVNLNALLNLKTQAERTHEFMEDCEYGY